MCVCVFVFFSVFLSLSLSRTLSLCKRLKTLIAVKVSNFLYPFFACQYVELSRRHFIWFECSSSSVYFTRSLARSACVFCAKSIIYFVRHRFHSIPIDLVVLPHPVITCGFRIYVHLGWAYIASSSTFKPSCHIRFKHAFTKLFCILQHLTLLTTTGVGFFQNASKCRKCICKRDVATGHSERVRLRKTKHEFKDCLKLRWKKSQVNSDVNSIWHNPTWA